MRELQFIRAGKLEWREREKPQLLRPTDAIVRPFVAGRCDGDMLPISRPVSRALQLGMHIGCVDPIVGTICGKVPFQGPFGIGHECVAEVIAVGPDVHDRQVGDVVVVPWAVSCGECRECQRGLTAKCSTMREETLAAFGFGASCGPWGGMIVDELRVPNADHMLVPVPGEVDPLRVASASDNLADAWRCIVPPLEEIPGGSVLVVAGAAKSIGLYAAGIAVRQGASTVDYLDDDKTRLAIAAEFGANPIELSTSRRRSLNMLLDQRYDIVVEASSRSDGMESAIRMLAPGGICTAVGYYLSPGTKVPIMHMYATSATLRVGVSHVRPVLPTLLDFVANERFPAERVTTLTGDWEDAPTLYKEVTTKLVLQRPRLYGANSSP
ncbi:alcohol dehydrogenase catalytic domain-containing protein [Bremerella sp. JC770]|uniref:zinc-dependent alcohol dehydrogenase n=1 Tax=Bremerella sp. JC770 TaxID=3232137 RepID=UPI003457EA2F